MVKVIGSFDITGTPSESPEGVVSTGPATPPSAGLSGPAVFCPQPAVTEKHRITTSIIQRYFFIYILLFYTKPTGPSGLILCRFLQGFDCQAFAGCDLSSLYCSYCQTCYEIFLQERIDHENWHGCDYRYCHAYRLG